jgi:hypothetical protein
MSIEVVPYTSEWIPAVERFNARMEAGGARFRWYPTPVDYWIPRRDPGQRVWREHHLAVDGSEVRAGFALTFREFLCAGEPHVFVDHQGPITEGVVDPRQAVLGFRLIRWIHKRHRLVYTWGHGDDGQAMLRMLQQMGFPVHRTPFLLRVLRPSRFLRRNLYLRGSPARRRALDALAWSGLGAIGIGSLHAALGLRGARRPRAQVEVVDGFGEWADRIWERSRGDYRAIAARDRATLAAALPPGGWPAAIRLRVSRAGEPVGWAVVLDTAMQGDRRFGDLRVGSVIDCLASPSDAEDVVAGAWRFLRDRGVDLVFSNQAHPAWIAAFRAQGFLALRDRRCFCFSPEIAELLAPLEASLSALHLTNIDGHGPIRL